MTRTVNVRLQPWTTSSHSPCSRCSASECNYGTHMWQNGEKGIGEATLIPPPFSPSLLHGNKGADRSGVALQEKKKKKKAHTLQPDDKVLELTARLWLCLSLLAPCTAGTKPSQPTGPACTLVCPPARLDLMQPAVTSNEGRRNNKAALERRLVEIKVENMTRHISVYVAAVAFVQGCIFFFLFSISIWALGRLSNHPSLVSVHGFSIFTSWLLRCAACLRNTVHFSLQSAGHCLADTHSLFDMDPAPCICFLRQLAHPYTPPHINPYIHPSYLHSIPVLQKQIKWEHSCSLHPSSASFSCHCNVISFKLKWNPHS